jgi:hypothetical protein
LYFSFSISCGYILDNVDIGAIFQAEGNSHNTAPSKISKNKGKAGISGKVDSADNPYFVHMSETTKVLLCL